jgi:hypothetical protein
MAGPDFPKPASCRHGWPLKHPKSRCLEWHREASRTGAPGARPGRPEAMRLRHGWPRTSQQNRPMPYRHRLRERTTGHCARPDWPGRTFRRRTDNTKDGNECLLKADALSRISCVQRTPDRPGSSAACLPKPLPRPLNKQIHLGSTSLIAGFDHYLTSFTLQHKVNAIW